MADCAQFLVNYLGAEKVVEDRFYDLISSRPVEVEERDAEEIKTTIKDGLNALGENNG